MQILLVTCGAAHLPHVARALQARDALAGLWITDKNRVGIAPDKYRRAWIFHLAMKPFYHLTSLGFREKMIHVLLPLWKFWVRRQKPGPCDAIYAQMGYGTEAFDLAERIGALKVADSSNGHPTSFFGFWQRECDIWCPGAKVGIPRRMFARVNRELERADIILCPSTYVRDSMIYNGISEDKCVINPYGVDTSIFKPRTQVPAKPCFICVGGICLRKGHQYLFRAFEKVRKVFPEAELICAGGYYPDFRQERPRWEGTFTHVEGLPQPELAKLLNRASAFVLPSNEESIARSIVEAMGAGLPIIGTYESGAPTLVQDGAEGLIVKARNVDSIAEAMIKLARDPELNRKMGEAAYARGARNNSWGDYADRLIKIVGNELAARTGRGSSPPGQRLAAKPPA